MTKSIIYLFITFIVLITVTYYYFEYLVNRPIALLISILGTIAMVVVLAIASKIIIKQFKILLKL